MLQTQTIRPECLAILKELMSLRELEDFRLAGGTALSLHLGHRISIDLDLFTNHTFDVDEFITFLKSYFNNRLKIAGSNRYGVFTSINDVKVDFLYRYEKFINNAVVYEGVRLSSLDDIGAMKIHAAANRVSKKDYYDLFELLNVYTFAELVALYTKMFTNYEVASLLKSLSNFTENDLEEDPVSLRAVSWEAIKDKMSEEIKGYINMLQQSKIEAKKARQQSIEEISNRKKNKN